MVDYIGILLNKNKSLADRFEAVVKLGDIGDRASINVLVEAMLHDPSPVIRHECAFYLGNYTNRNTAPYLALAIENDSSTFVRHEALLALAEVGNDFYIPLIEKYLRSDDLEVRETAEIALAVLKKRFG